MHQAGSVLVHSEVALRIYDLRFFLPCGSRGFTIFPDRNPVDYKVILAIHEPQLGPRSLKHAPGGFGTDSLGSSSGRKISWLQTKVTLMFQSSFIWK